MNKNEWQNLLNLLETPPQIKHTNTEIYINDENVVLEEYYMKHNPLGIPCHNLKKYTSWGEVVKDAWVYPGFTLVDLYIIAKHPVIGEKTFKFPSWSIPNNDWGVLHKKYSFAEKVANRISEYLTDLVKLSFVEFYPEEFSYNGQWFPYSREAEDGVYDKQKGNVRFNRRTHMGGGVYLYTPDGGNDCIVTASGNYYLKQFSVPVIEI